MSQRGNAFFLRHGAPRRGRFRQALKRSTACGCPIWAQWGFTGRESSCESISNFHNRHSLKSQNVSLAILYQPSRWFCLALLSIIPILSQLAAALCDVRWWEARWDGLVQERRILENCRDCSVLATCSPLATWRSFWIQGWGPLFLACSTSEKCREWDCGRTGCSSSVAFIPASWWCGHLASLPKHDILYNWILVVVGLVLALCFTWLHMQGRRSASVLLLAVEIGPKFNCGGGSDSAAAHLQSTEYT